MILPWLCLFSSTVCFFPSFAVSFGVCFYCDLFFCVGLFFRWIFGYFRISIFRYLIRTLMSFAPSFGLSLLFHCDHSPLLCLFPPLVLVVRCLPGCAWRDGGHVSAAGQNNDAPVSLHEMTAAAVRNIRERNINMFEGVLMRSIIYAAERLFGFKVRFRCRSWWWCWWW